MSDSRLYMLSNSLQDAEQIARSLVEAPLDQTHTFVYSLCETFRAIARAKAEVALMRMARP